MLSVLIEQMSHVILKRSAESARSVTSTAAPSCITATHCATKQRADERKCIHNG